MSGEQHSIEHCAFCGEPYEQDEADLCSTAAPYLCPGCRIKPDEPLDAYLRRVGAPALPGFLEQEPES